MQYILLLFTVVLLAVEFTVNKAYQHSEGTSLKAGLAFNALIGLFTAIIFFVINGFKIEITSYSVLMAALISCFIMCYNIIGFKLLKSGTMAMYTLFLMTGGMILPYLFGVSFLNEPFSAARMIGLALILAGVILANFRNAKISPRQIAMCIAVFVLNGFVSVFSKLHQIEIVFDTVNATGFVLLIGIFKFVLAGILYVFLRKGGSREPAARPRLAVLLITAAAMANGGAYLLQLQCAAALPATVLYPFVTGGSIVFSALAGLVFFKETLSKRLIGSILLCFFGTVMFL